VCDCTTCVRPVLLDDGIADTLVGARCTAITLTSSPAHHLSSVRLHGDFLSVYNPMVRAAQERYGWFPMPEFTFGVWLTGLCLLVIVGIDFTDAWPTGFVVTSTCWRASIPCSSRS
jgi:hypothetical protein